MKKELSNLTVVGILALFAAFLFGVVWLFGVSAAGTAAGIAVVVGLITVMTGELAR